MKISKKTIDQIKPAVEVQIPHSGSFRLPEKVLQFGTGVLLRGLPDYFIDQANKQGIFNGRIVMVKSTDHGDTHSFDLQDNIYTLCVRGLQNGGKVEEYFLNNAVSRVLNAQSDWDQILQCAALKAMEIVISNTTEVGIQLTEDDITRKPPASFPGKLLGFLYARYQAFGGDKESGMVIIPTELISDNGLKLKNILIQLAEKNSLSQSFIHWLTTCNTFCNSLVDRIVPGKPDKADKEEIEKKLGYKDDLLICAEPYRLWAIETPDSKTAEILSFGITAKGIILSEDISKNRELKLRLLNGTHTFSCAMAYLNGFETVKETTGDPAMNFFIRSLMREEIVPSITGDKIGEDEALRFSTDVLDRFSNPYMVHRWLSIAVQYTFKLRMRCVPVLLSYYNRTHEIPRLMAQSFAAYIIFMKSEKRHDGLFYGSYRDKEYLIQDDYALFLHQWWNQFPKNPVKAVLSDIRLWEINLSEVPGLVEEIEKYISLWGEANKIILAAFNEDEDLL